MDRLKVSESLGNGITQILEYVGTLSEADRKEFLMHALQIDKPKCQLMCRLSSVFYSSGGSVSLETIRSIHGDIRIMNVGTRIVRSVILTNTRAVIADTPAGLLSPYEFYKTYGTTLYESIKSRLSSLSECMGQVSEVLRP